METEWPQSPEPVKREYTAGPGTEMEEEGPESKVAKLEVPKREEKQEEEDSGSQWAGSAGPPSGLDPEPELTKENFREEGLSILRKELAKYGNPAAYLRSKYPTTEARERFAEQLLAVFPRREDMVYTGPGEMPPNTTQIFALHPSDLSFQEWASTKPPPFLVTSNALLDEYLCNTFITEGHVFLIILMVSQNGNLVFI